MEGGAFPRHAPGTIVREIGGETLLLQPDTGYVHRLNGTATLIWGLCDGDTPLNAIAEALAEHFDIGRDLAVCDLQEMVDHLSRLNLLEV